MRIVPYTAFLAEAKLQRERPLCECERYVDYVNVPKYRRRKIFGFVALVDAETCGSFTARSRSGRFITSLYAQLRNGRAWNARQQSNRGFSGPNSFSDSSYTWESVRARIGVLQAQPGGEYARQDRDRWHARRKNSDRGTIRACQPNDLGTIL
jgi:hypothetical protein